MRPAVGLTAQELELLGQYRALEARARPGNAGLGSAAERRAAEKARLVAAAEARERGVQERRAREREALMKRKAEEELARGVGEEEEAKRVAVAVMSEVASSETVKEAAAPVVVVGRKPPAGKGAQRDWDPEDPGWPFGGLVAASGEEAKALVEQSQHCAQNDGGFVFRVPLAQLPRTLDPRMHRKKYTWVAKNRRSTLHWSARKLLGQDIEFLSTHGRKDTLVVYAGAAPGSHIRVLVDLFPDMSFILVDSGAPIRVAPSDRVALWNDGYEIFARHVFFLPLLLRYTDKTLMDLRSRKERKLLISDMHTVDRGNDVDQYVAADMERQLEWHERLAPEWSLLKFRLPWEEGSTQYLDGEVFFSCFGPQTTTETRLLVAHGAGRRDYDHKTYEEQLFYFNRMTRVQHYEHAVVDPGIDHCFDCARTVQILTEHLQRHDSWYEASRNAADGRLEAEIPAEALAAEVARLNRRIVAELERRVDERAMMEGAAGVGGAVAESRPEPGDEVVARHGGGQAHEEEIDYGDVLNL